MRFMLRMFRFQIIYFLLEGTANNKNLGMHSNRRFQVEAYAVYVRFALVDWAGVIWTTTD